MSKTSAWMVFGQNYERSAYFRQILRPKMKRFSRELRRLSKPEENDKGNSLMQMWPSCEHDSIMNFISQNFTGCKSFTLPQINPPQRILCSTVKLFLTINFKEMLISMKDFRMGGRRCIEQQRKIKVRWQMASSFIDLSEFSRILLYLWIAIFTFHKVKMMKFRSFWSIRTYLVSKKVHYFILFGFKNREQENGRLQLQLLPNHFDQPVDHVHDHALQRFL